MALKPLNSVAGFSVGETPSNIILSNGDITTTNFTASGVSNLGPVGNLIITGYSECPHQSIWLSFELDVPGPLAS